ncbi:MAG TPA: low affinity iron permease family protein [Dongiaceae bacterium]|jgi:low affinity Fe/Cu permease|nr:low affinity iron permease family protein [Dongiaceae bacterium]
MNVFDRTASYVARLMGHPATFALACLVILLWGLIGPIAGYSDSWQLVINTSTTIVTFLMVFLIQNTQNRDSHALHLKIDELLRALDAADTRLVDLEERSEKDLERLHQHYLELAERGQRPREASRQTGEAANPGDQPATEPRNQPPRQGVQGPTT